MTHPSGRRAHHFGRRTHHFGRRTDGRSALDHNVLFREHAMVFVEILMEISLVR